MLKKLVVGIFSIALFVSSASIAFAHVTVKPDQVGVASFQTFNVSVPNEKDHPTVSVRLVIPESVEHVTPTVKPGWQIETKTSGESGDLKVTEITWSGGSIPAERREDFSFSAQVPADETALNWKAYQTYSDGAVVAWDQDPGSESHGETEESNDGPYSITKVVDDLTTSENTSQARSDLPLLASGFAVLVSLIAVSVALKSKRVK